MMDTNTKQIHNFQSGDLFDRHYRLLEHVGSGGFADVWKARDELVDAIVALKIYTRLDKEDISELAKEYKEMRGIKHPNLLTGNHFDASGNIPYLEMDFCDGGSLSRKAGKMNNEELSHVLRDITNGLAYLHREGIVHQDIKPENILYDTRKDRYLLSDFGISSKSRTRLSKSVNMANLSISMTEAYAPPEKFSGNAVDRMPDTKGDIFSLGLTFYELITGELPFDPPMAAGREMLYSHGQLQLDYSSIADPLLRQVVELCTKYRKEDRPSAEEIIRMTENANQQTDSAASKTENTVPKDKNNPKDKNKKTERIKPQDSPNTHTDLHPRKEKDKKQQQTNPNRSVTRGVVVIIAIFAVALFFLIFESVGGNNSQSRYKKIAVNDVVFGMVKVKGGVLSKEEKGLSDGSVSSGAFLNDYYIGESEVTQELWQTVMGNNPSNYVGENFPVEQISYKDIGEFIERLNAMTGMSFRLPTEDEWEFAAKGGNKTRWYTYSGSDNIDEVAWYDGNNGPGGHAVMEKRPNELGLYDMSGNVWEWCTSSGEYTSVLRGGGRVSTADRCSVESSINPSRIPYPHRGFRLAMSAL